jgi:hypothetical protein
MDCWLVKFSNGISDSSQEDESVVGCFISVSLAAVPPPVRKAYGFPSSAVERRGFASGGVAANRVVRFVGKPEAFRNRRRHERPEFPLVCILKYLSIKCGPGNPLRKV